MYQLRKHIKALLAERKDFCHRNELVDLREEMESKYRELEESYEKLELENKILEEQKQLEVKDLKEKLAEAYARSKAASEYQECERKKHLEEVQKLEEKCQDLQRKQELLEEEKNNAGNEGQIDGKIYST